jgi:TPR repeat protein
MRPGISLPKLADLAVTLALVLPAVAADYEAGRRFDQLEDSANALKEWRVLAEAGDARAQLELGLTFYFGSGGIKDEDQARQWFEKAATAKAMWKQLAEQGKTFYQVRLGLLLYCDPEVTSDQQDGLKWIRTAAKHDDPEAQFILAGWYERGEGVQQDHRGAEMAKGSRSARRSHKPSDNCRDAV